MMTFYMMIFFRNTGWLKKLQVSQNPKNLALNKKRNLKPFQENSGFK